MQEIKTKTNGARLSLYIHSGKRTPFRVICCVSGNQTDDKIINIGGNWVDINDLTKEIEGVVSKYLKGEYLDGGQPCKK